MRAGIVATIRVNPKDCQSVLDVMYQVGINTNGMSFPQLVSLAFASMLETNRMAGILPEPDEFQYLNRLGSFIGQQRTSKKLAVAKTLADIGPKVKVVTLAMPKEAVQPLTQSPGVYVPTEVTGEQRSASTRLSELLAKKDLADDGKPGVVWSADDQREFDDVYSVVYPSG